MAEIISAEELTHEASEMCSAREEFDKLVNLIRSRDKAIVERIKHEICNKTHLWEVSEGIGPDRRVSYHRDNAELFRAINSVLRDLGIE